MYSESQYKHQINRKWKLKKTLSAHEKSDLCLSFCRNGLDMKKLNSRDRNMTAKLRRHIKACKRKGIALLLPREGLAKEQHAMQHTSASPV
jgi:hypothetical protein